MLLSNLAPTTADNTVVTVEDTSHTFELADFPFADGDGDGLTQVQVTGVESAGALELSGAGVTLGQVITAAELTAGDLTYLPASDANGVGYDSFQFRVHDGTEYSAAVSTLDVVDATFDADAGGFAYADDTFGTNNPGYADGTYEAAGGFAGGGLRVLLGPGNTNSETSGGWSEGFNVASEGIVRVSLRHRMLMGEGFESNEYGEALLDVDGALYGSAVNNSLSHVVGDGNGGGTDDTGWLYDEFDIVMGVGNHTITVGAYNNRATFTDEWLELFVDDVAVTYLTYNTMTVDVTPANDAPVNAVPGSQTTPQNTGLVFSTANGNAISVSDLDAGNNDLEVTLTADNGTITLSTFDIGLDLQVNSTTVDAQTAPAIATADDGSYVVVWQSMDQDNPDGKEGIYGQRYDASGTSVGGEFQVNTTTVDAQKAPAIAMADDGSFVVVWQSKDQDDPDGKEGIYGQRYDAGGTQVGGEFLINTATVQAQTAPAIAMADDGSFVVVWQSKDQDNADGKEGIYGQRYDAGGTQVGGEFLINTTTVEAQMAPAIAVADDGSFVVVWQSKDQDNPDGKEGIYGQRYDAGGTTVGGEFLINTTTAEAQMAPAIAMADDGSFVVVWQSKDQDNPDGKEGIYGRRYDAGGGRHLWPAVRCRRDEGGRRVPDQYHHGRSPEDPGDRHGRRRQLPGGLARQGSRQSGREGGRLRKKLQV